MRRWNGHGALAIACRPCRRFNTFHVSRQSRFISTGNSGYEKKKNHKDYERFAIFRRTPVPETGRIDEWAALLDGALPPHLRDPRVSPPLLTLAATDLAEVLLAAQLRRKGRREGYDLLFHLGFEQGRWSAVVWLIKKLVDRFPVAQHSDTATLEYLALWNQVPPFPTPLPAGTHNKPRDDLPQSTSFTGYAADLGRELPFHLQLNDAHAGSMLIEEKCLDELTGSPGEDAANQQELAHNALGQIWRTLGAMTQACAGGKIRQEVLEIIAYLHHREIMPTSVYQYQPRMDKSAIQQPPLVPLLSSRILASLSDAAWAAHEKLMVDEAKVRLGSYASRGPAVLAAPYRARIDSLLPEVWLELILWSCLHGGWIEHGSDILVAITRREDWRPLSWREYEKALPATPQLNSNDWDAWDYLFKTRARSTMDSAAKSTPEVQRTVSAEVVNAYIDALAGLSDHSTVKASLRVIFKFVSLKDFLAKQDLGLTTGSWDALVARVLESQGEIPEKAAKTTRRTVELSPGLGQGLKSSNTQDLPAYVLDSGLAMQGILNRVLYGEVVTGSLQPALKVFSEMLARTDRDKQTSITSFMEGSKPLLRALHGDDMFTSNVTGIDYPAFNLQIPTTTLALFLDLVTQSKEYEFGRWLLYSEDADGPVIRKEQYNDEFLLPSLVKFAAATQDSKLFSTLRSLPNFSFHYVLDAQIEAMRWDAATGIVEQIPEARARDRDVLGDTWNMDNLANLTRVMLSLVPGARAGMSESKENLESAKRLFSTMVQQIESKRNFLAIKAQTLLSAFASVDNYWANFCYNLRRRDGHHAFILATPQFNHLLEGVVTAHGSTAGRRLLDLFWPQSVRRSQRELLKPVVEEGHEADKPRIVVPLHGVTTKRQVVIYGAVEPNVRTICLILRKALEELRDRPKEAKSSRNAESAVEDDEREKIDDEPIGANGHEMVAWAARQMVNVAGVTSRSDVIYNIGRVLHELEMEDLREGLSDIVRGVEEHLRDDPISDDAEDADDDV